MPTPARPGLAGWRKILLIIAFIAAGLRLVMFLLLHFPTHRAAPIPTWPLHAGDILPFTPGDANIAKWSQDPLSTGFVVQLLQPNGDPMPTPTFCALEPDYMADAQQPGGALTLLSQQSSIAQQPAGIPQPTSAWQPGTAWRVRWSGGPTMPPFAKKQGHFDANCGVTATLIMTSTQLHSLLDILSGIADSAPPPTSASH